MSSEMNSTTEADNGESQGSTVIIFLSFSVLSACISKLVFSKYLKDKISLPFTVAVLLLGFLIGIIITQTKTATNDFMLGEIQLSEINPHLMFYIFLPLLIFDSAFNGHFHVIKQYLLSGILLAGPGVFIAAAAIAVCGIYIFPYNWSWLVGLMFGSILSATDTVAVIALLHDSGASKMLASLIDAESLLNDGSSFVIFLIFRDLVVGGDHRAKTIVTDIVKYSIGGPAFGIACGIISVIILNRINNQLEVEITFTFGLAYLVFYIADVELGVSAVLAIVAMGLYMSKYKYCISSNVQPALNSVWRIAAYFVNILVFTITGIILAKSFVGTGTSITGKDFGYSIVLYIIIHLGRVVTVTVLYPAIKCTGVHLTWKDCVILSWSGLRGSMALILVLIVRLDTRIDVDIRERCFFHVSMIVLLTLIINGASSKFLVRLLGLHYGTKESEEVLLQALEHMRRQTSRKLAEMKRDEKFADVDWQMLNEYLPDKLLEELDEENNTTLHRRLSSKPNKDSREDSHELQPIPTVYQTDAMPESPVTPRNSSERNDMTVPIIPSQDTDDQSEKNIRNELITRLLTAMSIDYEKQWYLGMIRRKTMNILIKSVEEAKQQCSLKLHWRLIQRHFRLPFSIRLLMKIHFISQIKHWRNRLIFDHIFRTIELTLSFHSAKTRLDSIRLNFPELGNLNEQIMTEVYDEVQKYQLDAMHILLDLQNSYRNCWTLHMTRRCAQMLLKYESIAIIQLYETGMLEENEYSRILNLIDSKLFALEYGTVKMFRNRKKKLEKPYDLIPFFQTLSASEKREWKPAIKSQYQWFQPGAVLIEKNQKVSTAYLIIRGIVKCKDDTAPTYYKSGNIIGIDALYTKESLSAGKYIAHGGLVQACGIDVDLLDSFLADKKIARSIYDEIALHVMMNIYRKSLNLTHSRLKTLLKERSKFYQNEPDVFIHLQANQNLFLVSGTIKQTMNERETELDAIEFIVLESPAVYQLNSSSIVYTWSHEDEVECSNAKKYKISFSADTQVKPVEPFYPLFLGDTIEFTPRRQSFSMTRPVDDTNNVHLIPSEIEVNKNLSIPSEFS